MLKRKSMAQLIDWKTSGQRKALIISGARQVGKTFIVRVFGEEQYESYIELSELFWFVPYKKLFSQGNNPGKTAFLLYYCLLAIFSFIIATNSSAVRVVVSF